MAKTRKYIPQRNKIVYIDKLIKHCIGQVTCRGSPWSFSVLPLYLLPLWCHILAWVFILLQCWWYPMHPLLSSIRHSCFCTGFSMSGRRLIMDELQLTPGKTELLFISGDASPCQDLGISLDNSSISSQHLSLYASLGLAWPTNCPSCPTLLNWLTHLGFFSTALGGSSHFYLTMPLGFLLSSLSFRDCTTGTPLLAGLPLCAIRPWLIQNAAAILVFNFSKFSHTNPLLRASCSCLHQI